MRDISRYKKTLSIFLLILCLFKPMAYADSNIDKDDYSILLISSYSQPWGFDLRGFFEKYHMEMIAFFSLSVNMVIVGYHFRKKSKNRLKLAYDELKLVEANMRYQAEHDYLTDLPNRRASMKELDNRIKEGKEYTVIIINIDDFHEINSVYGQGCGDIALSVISKRLKETFKNYYLHLSRFGGDEFLLIIDELGIGEDHEVIKKIREVFIKTMDLKGIKVYMQISIGIASSKGKIENTNDIVSNANLALDEAKKSGKNKLVFYNDYMRKKLTEKKKIEHTLNEALNNDGFYLLYQPQIDTTTKQVSGYEALLRLKDQSYSPGQFISIAEETDTILYIGRLVAKKVIAQMVKWRDNGMDLKPVAINFSNRQIRDKGYIGYLKDLLNENNIPPRLIEIEITENILINNDEEARLLFEEILSSGLGLALDDFGTGYSSINYLTYIPVNKIKIDRSLVQNSLKEGRDEFIQNIIGLAHSLDLEIIAEGVEEEYQYKRLKSFKCNYIQGYYFSKPVKGEEIEKKYK